MAIRSFGNIAKFNSLGYRYGLLPVWYDGLDRLTQADGPWGNGTSITYDANGNLLKQQLGSYLVNYGYDTQQRLTALGGTKNYSLAYDGWGNVTTRGDGSTWTYDAAGNLRWSNKSAASQIAYTYDGDGTRVLSVGNGLNRLEFYDHSNQLRYEKNLTTGVAKDYIYLAGQKVADTDGTTNTWYHNDPVGSPVSATDSNGTIVWRNFYHPYGERMLGDGGNTNKQWFGGKTYEDATGLSYFGARWYDPVIGRFMVMDPVDWKESNPVFGFNTYLFANANPYRYMDKDGRDARAVMGGAIIGGIIGGVSGYMSGKTVSSTLHGAVIGAAVGGISASAADVSAAAVISGVVSGIGNLTEQAWNNLGTAKTVNYSEVVNSAIFGAIGGPLAKKTAELLTPMRGYLGKAIPNKAFDTNAGKTLRESGLSSETFNASIRSSQEEKLGAAYSVGTVTGQQVGQSPSGNQSTNRSAP